MAQETGLSVAVIRAIQRVESGGRPDVIRFEPHHFLRNRPDMRGRIAYSASSGPSYVPSETNKAAFDRAFALDPLDAVRSTSWGSFQVLGSYLLGMFGNNASQAVRAFWSNPRQISDRLLGAWMRANPRARAAASGKDWHTFAAIYNGPKYYLRGYQNKLASAHSLATAQLAGFAGVFGAIPGEGFCPKC